MRDFEKNRKYSVAFICLGNYCRSPMAEAVFKKAVMDMNLEHYFDKIDSFGTCGYHIGEIPDPRTQTICKRYGVPVNHIGKMIQQNNFSEFDYIIGMDESNISDLRRMCKDKNNWKKIKLFGEWNKDLKMERIVLDPWGGDRKSVV